MKSKPQFSCAFAVAVLVVSSSLCDARPHAHGVLENLRRLIHPSNAGGGVSTTDAPTSGATPCGK